MILFIKTCVDLIYCVLVW